MSALTVELKFNIQCADLAITERLCQRKKNGGGR